MRTHICLNCGNSYEDNHKNSKYCSIKCQQEFQSTKKYNDYLDNQESYADEELSNPRWIKRFILNE